MILRILYCVFIFQVNVCCVSKRVVAENKEDTKVSSVVIPGHSHNDYEGREPLYEALRLGFKSIEVDVHLIGDELYVAHNRPLILDPTKTLEKMYLEPLTKVDFIQNPLYLLIDVKTDAEETYKKLEKVLSKYQNEKIEYVISGNRAIEKIVEKNGGLMSLDGRKELLNRGFASTSMPLISDHYKSFFSNRTVDKINPQEITNFREFINTAHEYGYLVRLWGSPDHHEMWSFLRDLGVDLINTDKSKDFADWYSLM